MTQKLFIPKKIKVGFQERKDTFTGKLAYVIYYDEKGKLRKESSWNSWRSRKIEPIEFENTPRNNYILNKGMFRYSDWGSGRAVIRVHDPREFEFEISVDNLIGILMHSDVSKRDITEECVFAWAGTELVLLPVNSEQYQESVKYTEKQDKKLSTKDLVKGRQYQMKKSDEVYTYLGFFDWYDWVDGHDTDDKVCRRRWDVDFKNHTNKGKKHIFHRVPTYGEHFKPLSVSTLSESISDEIVDNYAALVEEFFGTYHSQLIVGVKLVDAIPNTDHYLPKVYQYDEATKKVSCLSTSYSYTKNISNMDFYLYPNFLSFDKSVQIRYMKKEIPGSYSYARSYTRHDTVTSMMSTQLKTISDRCGYDFNNIQHQEYINMMKELGYQGINWVLQNGTLINY